MQPRLLLNYHLSVPETSDHLPFFYSLPAFLFLWQTDGRWEDQKSAQEYCCFGQRGWPAIPEKNQQRERRQTVLDHQADSIRWQRVVLIPCVWPIAISHRLPADLPPK